MFPDIPACPFYMLRHGQTLANAMDLLAGGGIDTPLTDVGIAQARQAVALVASLPVRPASIVHSHLSRARETAQIVNELMDLPMSENSDLGEQIGGDLEGQPFEYFRDLVRQDKDPPGGETLPNFRARVRKGLTSALETHRAPVLIVAHGGVFRAFGDLYGFTFRGVGNCHLYEFQPRTAPKGQVPWDIFHWTKEGQTLSRTQRDI